MRKSLACLTLSLTLLAANGAWGEESLLFNVSSSRSHSEVKKTRRVAIRPADELIRSLVSAGYQPKQINDEAVCFTMNVNELSIPVMILNVGNGEQKRVSLMLTSLADAQQIPQAKLLKLLSGNNTRKSALFTYDKNSQQIELHRVMSSESARGIQLRDELDNLSEIASETEQLWNIGQVVAEPEGDHLKLNIRERSPLPVKKVSFTVISSSSVRAE